MKEKFCIKKLIKFSTVTLALVLSTSFSLNLPMVVLAKSAINPTYSLSWDYPDADTNTKNLIFPVNSYGGYLCDVKIHFANKTEVSPKQNYKFLMINGQLIPGAGVVTKDSVYYVPVKALLNNSKVLKWDEKKKVLTQVVDKKVTSSAGVMINNEYYVPLGFLSDYNFTIASYAAEPFTTFPVITIDTGISATASHKDINSIKQRLISTLDQAKKKYPKDLSSDSYNDAKKEIQKLTYTGNLSRYWVLQDNDLGRGYLVDSKTKKIFLFRYGGYWFYIDPLSVKAFYLMNFTA